MLVGVPSRSKVNFEFCADENATQLERRMVKILFFVFIDTIFDCPDKHFDYSQWGIYNRELLN
ncbi:hypothetical protein CLA01_10880 [Chryseobacterium lathyri]|uniref:Uncharacterized protein n=1 Tax=Chryseobacterium lathyri TaxID=395933 RepID=A0A511Y747_9FLAO|nr:hypothetical protein CLA01_10880 [Chryseobacterium lathyri]